MPRKQDIFAENPVLQSMEYLAQKVGKTVDVVKEAQRKTVATNFISEVGELSKMPSMNDVYAKIKSDMALSDQDDLHPETKTKLIEESLKDGDVADVAKAKIIERVLRDERRRKMIDFQLAAANASRKSEVRNVVRDQLGLVGMMNAGERAALGLALEDDMAGLPARRSDLDSLAKFMSTGKVPGGKGGGGGDGNFQRFEIDNGDGTKSVMVWDKDNPLAPPIPIMTHGSQQTTSMWGDEIKEVVNPADGSKMLYVPLAASLRKDPAALEEAARNTIQTYKDAGYQLISGDTSTGALIFKSPPGKRVGGGGGAKGDPAVKALEKSRAAMWNRIVTLRDNARKAKTPDEKASIYREAEGLQRSYNEKTDLINQLEPGKGGARMKTHGVDAPPKTTGGNNDTNAANKMFDYRGR